MLSLNVKSSRTIYAPPMCILDSELTSDGINNGVDRAGDNVQSGGVVRLTDVRLRQELVVDDMAGQQEANGLSDLGETGSVEVVASPQNSPSSWFSSASFTSPSTPFINQDDNIPLDYSNNELYTVEPALLGPPVDCATTCYPYIDLDDATDASNTVALEPLLPSRDTPALLLSGYVSDSAVTASNLPRRIVRSVSCPGELPEPLEGTANTDERMRKRFTPADKEALHDDSNNRRAEADTHHTPLDCDQNFQEVDGSVEELLPKQRRRERSSKGHKASVEESRTRCSSIDSAIRAKFHTSTPVRSLPNSPIAGTPLHDSQDDASMAEIEEWPLHNVLLKRITSNGVVRFSRSLTGTYALHIANVAGQSQKGAANSMVQTIINRQLTTPLRELNIAQMKTF